MTEEDEAKARAMRAEGISYNNIAIALNVSKNTIRYLLIEGERDRVNALRCTRREHYTMPPWVPDRYASDWRRAAHRHGEIYAAGVVRALKRSEADGATK